MKIAVGCDHRALKHKELAKRAAVAFGAEVVDLGTHSEESTDYPDFAFAVARAVASGEADKGILACSTGVGMSIAANKVRGVRAALVHNREVAALSRRHNDANVLCFGATVVPEAEVEGIVREWLSSEFEGGRHCARVCKIAESEA